MPLSANTRAEIESLGGFARSDLTKVTLTGREAKELLDAAERPHARTIYVVIEDLTDAFKAAFSTRAAAERYVDAEGYSCHVLEHAVDSGIWCVEMTNQPPRETP